MVRPFPAASLDDTGSEPARVVVSASWRQAAA
jgi:hypothetical protein